MPKLEGPLKISGTIGDISFYKRNGQYYARSKGGISAQRMRTDPAFARTRENQREFVTGVQAGKLLRKAMRQAVQRVRANSLSNRLTQAMNRILRTDTTHGRGQRTVQDGDLSLLEGLEVNRNATFDSTFFLPPTVSVDRAGGTATVDWPAHEPQRDVSAQSESTHYVLYALCATVDFAQESFSDSLELSTPLDLLSTSQAALSQSLTLPANTTLPVFILVGIEYLQELNGTYYPLRNGAYNALMIHTVDV
jgi:hypothetical protein